MFLSGVSCPSTRLCAVASQQSILTSTQPTGGAAAWKATPTSDRVSDVACPTAKLCVATGAAASTGDPEVLTSTDPTSRAPWKASNVGSPDVNFTGVSCPSIWLCVASDSEGRVFASSYPTAGSDAWTGTRVDQAFQFGLSCPSQSRCIGVDDLGNGVIGTGRPAPTSAAVRALFARAIKPRQQALALRAFLRHGRYLLPFAALTARRITISWSTAIRASRGNRTSRKNIVVARGSAALLEPGIAHITLKLTDRGGRVIKRSRRLTMIARGKLTRPDGTVLPVSSTFVFR